MNSNLQSNLVITLNSDKVLEYFRDVSLSASQCADLEAMDQKMECGLQLSEQQINNPSPQDKATFVAHLLITALINEEESKAAIACAYLATRFSELKQVRAKMRSGQLSIQLIFDEEYKETVPIKFVAKEDLN